MITASEKGEKSGTDPSYVPIMKEKIMGNLSYLNRVYGIPSERADEKRLVKELNALFNAKFKKVTHESMLKAREPRKLEYFYNVMFTKAEALYLELTPNEDRAGQLEAPEHPDCAWILIVRALPHFAEANGKNVDIIAQSANEKVERLSFGAKFLRNQDD